MATGDNLFTEPRAVSCITLAARIFGRSPGRRPARSRRHCGAAAGGRARTVLLLPVALAAGLSAALPAAAATGITALLRETYWGERAAELRRQFGAAATALPRPFDFGDSYAGIVLPHAALDGVPVVVFFEMDKKTHGLKRIQLEPSPHAANPPAFGALAAALAQELGRPEATCRLPPGPADGWQAAAGERWRRGGAVIDAIFRDTTLQAFEGCPAGPATGWCGLRGGLLIRLAPAPSGTDPCA
jgi:hypothetical protein